jgi:hypothetical protein
MNNNVFIGQLEFLRTIMFPSAYNIHADYFPGLGACRICGQGTEHTEDLDIYIATQKRVLELHEGRLKAALRQ